MTTMPGSFCLVNLRVLHVIAHVHSSTIQKAEIIQFKVSLGYIYQKHISETKLMKDKSILFTMHFLFTMHITIQELLLISLNKSIKNAQ